MRILHVVENLNRGGLERVVLDLAAYQIKMSHDVSIICLYEEGLLAQEAKALGIKVYAINRQMHSILKFLSLFRTTIKNISPDVIHTHNPIPNYFAVLATRFTQFTHIISTRHGMGVNLKKNKGKLFYYASQFFTQHVALVCDAAKTLFLKTHQVIKSKAITIKNGIVVNKFHARNLTDKADLCKNINIKNVENVVIAICIGRLNPVKDHIFLLQAYSKIQYPHLHIVIVGDGVERSNIETEIQTLGISNNIHMLGDRNDIPYLLSAADMFVLSSKSEGFSIALLEACAAKLAIIATDVGGNREIVKDNVNGILVESGNIKQMSQALEKLLDEEVRVQMGEASLEWVKKTCSIEVMYENYMRLYA